MAEAREIPLHGKRGIGRVALVDEADYDLISQYRWWLSGSSPSRKAYAVARIGTGHGAPMKYMHQLITGNRKTDHINHNGLDNRRHNLRPVTQGQNSANERPCRRGSSRYKGVAHNRHSTWTAKVKVNGNVFYLGNFAAELDAALAYDMAARRHFGEFACPNFPEGYKAMVEFCMDGPHTPDTVREAADLVAEGIRYLNYATRDDAPGLKIPADADSLIADLYTATGRLPQLGDQVRDFLVALERTGRLADANGSDVAGQLMTVAHALGLAHAAADELTGALQAAQNAVSSLYLKDEGDE